MRRLQTGAHVVLKQNEAKPKQNKTTNLLNVNADWGHPITARHHADVTGAASCVAARCAREWIQFVIDTEENFHLRIRVATCHSA